MSGIIDTPISLRQIEELPESELLMAMNPEVLTIVDGLIIIRIMKEKASHLNQIFDSNTWTTRKIDMILWSSERGQIFLAIT